MEIDLVEEPTSSAVGLWYNNRSNYISKGAFKARPRDLNRSLQMDKSGMKIKGGTSPIQVILANISNFSPPEHCQSLNSS
jgi:hypothetical protein